MLNNRLVLQVQEVGYANCKVKLEAAGFTTNKGKRGHWAEEYRKEKREIHLGKTRVVFWSFSLLWSEEGRGLLCVCLVTKLTKLRTTSHFRISSSLSGRAYTAC